jgi:hypothetical protein
MNPTAIYSKTGKGVQEASGRTSHLSRGDRAVLSAIDGKSTVAELNQKFDKFTQLKFQQLIEKMDKDGFVREVSPGTPAAQPKPARGAAPTPPPAKQEEDEGEELDFTSFVPTAPKAAAARAATTTPKAAATTPGASTSPGSSTSQRLDLAAKAHAEAQRKAEEEDAFDFRVREQAEAKAKQEAAARAKAEAEAKAKAAAAAKEKEEAEAKAKAAAEARQKADAEAKAKAEAEAKARTDSEAKSKALRDAAVRAASEARQKADAEAKAKAEAEARARKEADERARIEKELNAKLEAERSAREEAERKAKEDAERLAKEAEARGRREVEEKARQESEALRQQLEVERKAREEAERKAKEEADRRRKEDEEAARKRKEEEAAKRKAEEEAKRKAEEDAKRKADEEEAKRKTEEEIQRRTAEASRKAEEEAKRKQAEEAKRKEADEAKRKEDEAKRKAEEDAKRAPAPAASALPDDLLADLDSFAQRDEEEQKAREAAERKAKEDAERKAREAAERKAKEDAERKAREAEAKRQREQEERARAETEARAAREREEREAQEAEARKRQTQESIAAAAAQPAADEDDIGISDEDLDLDEIRSEERLLSKAAAKRGRKEAEAVPTQPAEGKKQKKGLLEIFKKKETTEKKEPKAKKEAKAPREKPDKKERRVRPPRRLGKSLGITVLVLLVAGVGVVHVLPMPTGDYERAASASLGMPVRISSANISLVTGVQVKLEGITLGSGKQVVRIVRARAYPGIGGLFSSQKTFSRIELEGARVPQAMIAQGLLGGLRGGALRSDSIVLTQATFDGPLTLPSFDVTLKMAANGRVASGVVRTADGLEVRLTPKGKEIGIEGKAETLTLPFLKGFALADVGMKGTATPEGLRLSAWDARVYDGVISGTAELRWGEAWSMSGDLLGKGINAAVFAPALLSAGKADAKGRFSMAGPNPAALKSAARLEGTFTLSKGVLGSFDLSRGIQTKGKQSSGRTLFAELTGEGVYEAGVVSMRNLNMGAGKLNAAGTLEISATGELNGRVVADVESGPRAINETFNLVGTLKEPRLVSPTR